ncbi:MAG: ATP-binding protein [Candidatus Thioglobus sp.]|nr:ATP-binding protein [Candidatus Thioglobus sp.]MDG1345224.1 ATP-binding protein [Candidatus Thioglobus sp.]MDG1956794.1 ATP-binding protein [Candidatus Thioglobus sp.]
MTSKTENPLYTLTKILLFVVFVCAVISIYWVHYGVVEHHTNNLRLKASESLGIYQNNLNNELTRFSFLPYVVARDEQLIKWSFNEPSKANEALENIVKASGTTHLYILDAKGTTLASSNWRSDVSFVGKNYGFRSYFLDAMSGNNGYFFGIGATSKLPGFFISTPVRNRENIIAAAVTKIDLSAIENSWKDAGETIFVTNKDGVVVLSSESKWKYHTLLPLSQLQKEKIKEQKQFAGLKLDLLTGQPQKNINNIDINGTPFLYETVSIDSANWKIHYLVPKKNITQLTIITWAKTGSIMMGLIAVLLLLRLTQSRWRLKISQQESLDLRKLNDQLTIEIAQRHETEKELLIAQQDIKRTSRLAAMGQLSASIIHELGQPLSAMKNYIASAQLPPKKGETSANNEKSILPKLDALVVRMTKISKQLKFFVRSNERELQIFDIKDSLHNALELLSSDLKKDGIKLTTNYEDKSFMVRAGKLRMEQVFINLINNARFALQESKNKQLSISIDTSDNNSPELNLLTNNLELEEPIKQVLIVKIEDTGKGMSEDTLEALFDPFYTTKPSGVSLGLGLAISSNIIHEFNGTLKAKNNTDQGACFVITLPLMI